MLNMYPRPATRAQQAHQLWAILTGWAGLKKKGRLKVPGLITYGEAAVLMDYKANAGRTLGSALGLISGFCDINGLPHLNMIVVDFETEEPGHGVPLSKTLSIQEIQQQVIDFKWLSYRTPSLRKFRELQGQYPS